MKIKSYESTLVLKLARLVTSDGKTYYGKILSGSNPRLSGGTKKQPLKFGKIVLVFEVSPFGGEL